MVDPAALEGGKQALFADLLARNESVAGQATLLGEAEVLGGDWRLAEALLARIIHERGRKEGVVRAIRLR